MFERHPTHASAFEYSGRRMIRVRRKRGEACGPQCYGAFMMRPKLRGKRGSPG